MMAYRNISKSSFASRERLRNWAAAYRGPYAVEEIQSKPAVSIGLSTLSEINASNNAASLPARGLHANMDIAGAQSYRIETGNPNATAIYGIGPNNLVGDQMGANLTRLRFQIEIPDFEICVVEKTGAAINLRIDGRFLQLGPDGIQQFGQSGNVRYMRVNFGENEKTTGLSDVGIGVGGSGYAVGDLITISGGTYATPAKLRVVAVSSGAVSVVKIEDAGDYSVLPSWPADTTGGTGTGLTVSGYFTFSKHTTLKPRNIELLVSRARVYGINWVAAGNESPLTPYRFNPRQPRLYWLGDSQDENTYCTVAGLNVGYIAACRMGLDDNVIIDAMGGTGFNKPNGNYPAFEHENRVGAIIDAAPDVVVFSYSQNVGSNTQSTSQEAALSFVSAIQSALPNTLLVMIGPAFGAQAWHLAAMQYVMANAPDAARIRMVDSITQGWTTTSTATHLTTDNTHLSNWSNVEWRSRILANGIVDAIIDMM